MRRYLLFQTVKSAFFYLVPIECYSKTIHPQFFFEISSSIKNIYQKEKRKFEELQYFSFFSLENKRI
jgi:hypothetical protein